MHLAGSIPPHEGRFAKGWLTPTCGAQLFAFAATTRPSVRARWNLRPGHLHPPGTVRAWWGLPARCGPFCSCVDGSQSDPVDSVHFHLHSQFHFASFASPRSSVCANSVQIRQPRRLILTLSRAARRIDATLLDTQEEAPRPFSHARCFKFKEGLSEFFTSVFVPPVVPSGVVLHCIYYRTFDTWGRHVAINIPVSTGIYQ